MTQVGVESIGWYRHEQTVEADGIGRELEERAAAMGAANPESQSLSMGIDGERFKYVADVLVEEAGITPMLHRLAVRRSSRAARSAASSPRASRAARRSSRSASSTPRATPTSRPGPARPSRKTPREEMLAASVMFSMTGVNKRAFLDEVKADPQTYRDWAGNAEWDIETTGKEDELFSPFLRKPFKQAVEEGLIPPNLITLAGTWGTVTDQGDLTYLNLVHLTGSTARAPTT